MKADSLVVAGECFWGFPTNEYSPELAENFRRLIMTHMRDKGYLMVNNLTSQTWEMVFAKNIDAVPMNIPLALKIGKMINKFSDSNLVEYAANKAFDKLVDSIPFVATINFRVEKMDNHSGFHTRIRAEPIIYYKFRRAGKPYKIEEYHYSEIVLTNKLFIEDIMGATHAVITKSPNALANENKTPFEEELIKYGFADVAKLLKDFRIDIEVGPKENSMSNLRSAYEIFIYEIIRKKGFSPKEQHLLAQNIRLLQDEGVIGKFASELIHKAVYEHIYKYMQNEDHKKILPVQKDLIFLKNLTENIFAYLIDIILFK